MPTHKAVRAQEKRHRSGGDLRPGATIEGQYDARDSATGSPDAQRTTTGTKPERPGPAEQNVEACSKKEKLEQRARSNLGVDHKFE
jgi:hypothetical protein